MAKVSTATVRFVLKMNRENKNHEHPIYVVVCFHGRLEKSTGISILARYWDKRSETIKRSCPNAPVLNKMLNDIKQRIIERRNHFEYNSMSYTPSMLLNDYKVDLSGSSSVFKDVMHRLVNERRLRHKTVDLYNYSYSKVCEFLGRDNFIVSELNLGFVKDFARWLGGKSDSTRRNVFTCIASVWNYAISKRLVVNDDYPFYEFKINERCKQGKRDYCVSELHIRMLMDYFLDMVIIRDGARWSYREGALERLHKKSSKEFAILWFLLCYKLNGSAPYEIGKLKMDECSRVRIGDDDYWALDFNRQKTDADVHVRMKRDVFCIIGLEHFMGFANDSRGYVYPIVGKDCVTEKQITNSINNARQKCIKWVREAFMGINKVIIQSNVDNDRNDALVEIDKVVMYTARHSAASHLLNCPNVSVRQVASILARSPNTISTYIHQITHNDEIADTIKNMPI